MFYHYGLFKLSSEADFPKHCESDIGIRAVIIDVKGFLLIQIFTSQPANVGKFSKFSGNYSRSPATAGILVSYHEFSSTRSPIGDHQILTSQGPN